MNDLFPFLTPEISSLIVKIIFLVLVGIYLIFVIIVFNNVRSLRRIIIISSAAGSPLIQFLAIFYLIATIVLFLTALLILP